MRVLVCGGRWFADRAGLVAALDAQHARTPITLLIQGGARGADAMAADWATARGIHVAEVRALWDALGHQAGPVRNGVMLTLAPELVIAFAGTGGTANMIAQAKAAGVRVWRPQLVREAGPGL